MHCKTYALLIVSMLLFSVCLGACRRTETRADTAGEADLNAVRWFSVLPDSGVAVVDGENISLVNKNRQKRVVYKFSDGERGRVWRVRFSPDRSRIVLYTVDMFHSYDYVMNPYSSGDYIIIYDISDKKVLYKDTSSAYWADWSSDGRQVAWISGITLRKNPLVYSMQVRRLDARTENAIPDVLCRNDYNHDDSKAEVSPILRCGIGWSAASTEIIGYDSQSIVKVNVNSRRVTAVDLSKYIDERPTPYTPPMHKSDVSVRGELLFLYNNNSLYTMDYKSLSPQTVRKIYNTSWEQRAVDAKWSPDGMRIACISCRYVPYGGVPSRDAGDHPPYAISVFDGDGKGAVEVLSGSNRIDMLDWISESEILYLSEGKLYRVSLKDGKPRLFL